MGPCRLASAKPWARAETLNYRHLHASGVREALNCRHLNVSRGLQRPGVRAEPPANDPLPAQAGVAAPARWPASGGQAGLLRLPAAGVRLLRARGGAAAAPAVWRQIAGSCARE